MGFTNELNKLLKNRQLCMILAILAFLAVVVFLYNNHKRLSFSTMTNAYSNSQKDDTKETAPSQHQGHVEPALSGLLEQPIGAAAGDVNTLTSNVPSSCMNQQVANPSDLLPSDPNRDFAVGQPTGQGELSNINLLKAGQLSGIDTVGSSLRNANLQVRSEPPNPRSQVSPWLNSTIEPDLMRVPLELGCGGQ